MVKQSIYAIKIGSHLGETRARLFENMEITPLPNGQMVISGPIVDQSALFGILIRIRDLGIPLISVNRVQR